MKFKTTAFLFLFAVSLHLAAQYPNINGISTNPANPINTQLPSKLNSFFDWQLERWQVKPLSNQGNCTRQDSLTSPFFRLDNAEELRVSKDMKWDDGWELIIRRVGLTDQNQPLPDNDPDVTVVLYNKYTGILRIMLQTCRGADYNAAQILLQFDGTSSMKTDLLEFSRGNIYALDKKFTSAIGSAGYDYSNNNSKWFYADFPMMFDPCTPLYQSKLNIVSKLITTSQIALIGKISGDIYTKDVAGKASVEKPGSFSWLNKTFLAASKFAQAFPSDTAQMVAEWLQYVSNQQNNNTNNISAVQQLAASINTIPFLKQGLSSVPWLKGALAAFDVLISGGKKADPSGPQTVKVMPLVVNLTANLQGTISTDAKYHDVIFTNPGSKDAHLDPGGYPYYNEVLGVFNLIKTPEVWWERRQENLNDSWNYPWISCPTPNTPVYGQCQALRVNVDRFKLDTSTFKWVLNPAAGMTIQNMQLELITEGTYTPSYYQAASPDPFTARQMPSDFVFNGRDGSSGDYKFSTGELLHAKNFAKRTWKVISNVSPYYPNNYYGLWGVWSPKGIIANDTTAFLKVILNLKRNNTTANTQNVLYVLTYPVKLKAGGYMQYWENDVSYRYGTPQDTTLITSPTPAEVNSFCQSNVYWNIDRQSRTIRDSLIIQERLEKDGIALFPNPNKGEFNVKFKQIDGLLSNIFITDISGRRVYISSEGNQSLTSGLLKRISINLPGGTYILTATTTNGVLKTKFIVTR